MRYLCAFKIHKKKFLSSFRLAKKKFFWGNWVGYQLLSYELMTTDLENQIHKIYVLFMRFHIHTVLIFASLKALPSCNKQSYSSLSCLKLQNYLTMHNIFPIYMLLFSSNFDFCVTTLKELPSWNKQLYSSLSHLKLQHYII